MSQSGAQSNSSNAWSRTPGKTTQRDMNDTSPLSGRVGGWGNSSNDNNMNSSSMWNSNPPRPSTLGLDSGSSGSGGMQPSLMHQNSLPGVWNPASTTGAGGALRLGDASMTPWSLSEMTGESDTWGMQRSNSLTGGWGNLPTNTSSATTTSGGVIGAPASTSGGPIGSLPPVDPMSSDPGGIGPWGPVSGDLGGADGADTNPNWPPASGADESSKPQDEVVTSLVNSNEGWGRRPVNQTTAWDTGDSPSGLPATPRIAPPNMFLSPESNVWTNEPPTGTGIWEAHYEQLGERTARWQQNASGGGLPTGGGPPMMPGAGDPIGTPWDTGGGRNWDMANAGGPGGDFNSNWPDKRRVQHPSGGGGGPGSVVGGPGGRIGMWNEGIDTWGGGGGAPDPTSPIGNRPGGDPGSIWSIGGSGGGPPSIKPPGGWSDPPGGNAWPPDGPGRKVGPGSSGWPPMGGGKEDVGGFGAPRRGVMQAMVSDTQLVNRMRNENQMRVHQVKHLTDMGFKKEEAQNALISNNMDLERTIADLRDRQLMGGAGDMPDMDMGYQGGQPGGGMRGMNPSGMNPNPQLMKHQIMQQVRFAFNNRMQNPGGPGSSGPQGPMHQKEAQIRQSIHMVQQKMQTMQHKIANLSSQASSPGSQLSSLQLQQMAQDCQSHMNSYSQELNYYQNQLKMLHQSPHMPPGRGGGNQASMADMMSQMNQLRMNPGGNGPPGSDVSEFVPGQPWSGVMGKDDPNLPLGSANRGIMSSVNNEHLERLAATGDAPKMHPYMSGGGGGGGGNKPWPPSGGGMPSSGIGRGGGARWGGPQDKLGTPEPLTGGGTAWLLLHSIPNHLSLELIKSAVYQQAGLVHLVPNMSSRWVILCFSSSSDAAKAAHALEGKAGRVEPLSEQEAQHKTQEINNLATRFNLSGLQGPSNPLIGGGSGPMGGQQGGMGGWGSSLGGGSGADNSMYMISMPDHM